MTPRKTRVESLEVAAEPLLNLHRPSWQGDSLCADPAYPTALFFPSRGQSPAAAIAVCERCLVTIECLEYALADPNLDGVWAGTTPDDRRRMRGAS